jgi:hypothetical protein
MPNLIFATGHYRNGVLLAPLTPAHRGSSSTTSESLLTLTSPSRAGIPVANVTVGARRYQIRTAHATRCGARLPSAQIPPNDSASSAAARAKPKPSVGFRRG